MKKVIAVVLLLTMVLAMALTSNAGTVKFKVKKGTPTVDGKLDNLYLDSAAMPITKVQDDEKNPKYPHVITSSDAYALWDNNYLYFYIVAWDDTLCNNDVISIGFHIGEPYFFTINFKDQDFGISNNDTKYFKVDDCVVVGGLNTEGGYAYVEARIAFSDEKKANFGGGKQFGFHWVYWNDVDNDGTTDNNSISSSFFVDDLMMSNNTASGTGNKTNADGSDIYGPTGTATPVNTISYTPSAPSTDNKDDNKGDNKGDNKNPQTSDAFVAVGAIALCAAAAAVVLVKKKRA